MKKYFVRKNINSDFGYSDKNIIAEKILTKRVGLYALVNIVLNFILFLPIRGFLIVKVLVLYLLTLYENSSYKLLREDLSSVYGKDKNDVEDIEERAFNDKNDVRYYYKFRMFMNFKNYLSKFLLSIYHKSLYVIKKGYKKFSKNESGLLSKIKDLSLKTFIFLKQKRVYKIVKKLPLYVAIFPVSLMDCYVFNKRAKELLEKVKINVERWDEKKYN